LPCRRSPLSTTVYDDGTLFDVIASQPPVK
jgi:hypothetical protein